MESRNNLTIWQLGQFKATSDTSSISLIQIMTGIFVDGHNALFSFGKAQRSFPLSRLSCNFIEVLKYWYIEVKL